MSTETRRKGLIEGGGGVGEREYLEVVELDVRPDLLDSVRAGGLVTLEELR